MTDLARYYDESLPPSLWGGTDQGVPSRGATAGIPGSWTPAGSTPPADPAALGRGNVVASPATAWTSGQYVQTRTTGPAGRATWTGTAWVGGAAPLSEEPEEPETGPDTAPEGSYGDDAGLPPPEPPAGGGGASGATKRPRRS